VVFFVVPARVITAMRVVRLLNFVKSFDLKEKEGGER